MLLAGPAGLLFVGVFGYTSNPPAWWVVALFMALCVRAGSLRLDRPIERRYARVVGLLATCWLGLAWQFGPYRPALALPLLVLSPIAVLPWLLHRRIRSAASVDWPRVRGRARTARAAWELAGEFVAAARLQVRAAREFRRMRSIWPWQAALRPINLPGSELVSGHWSADRSRTLTLRLEGGRTIEDVRQVKDRMEALWKAGVGTLSVGVGERADRVLLKIVAEIPPAVRPLDVVRKWPGAGVTSVMEPLPLGEWEDGTPILLRLTTDIGMVGGHWLVAGQTRWGKSGILNVLLATLAGCDDVVFWGLDPKGGLELHPWHPLLQRLATSARDAVPFLRAANAERERREAILRVQGRRLWTPSPETPLLLLVVDEASRLDEDAMKLLDDLCAMGAASGICVVVCTQRPSAAKLGKTGDLRAQLGSQVSVKLRDAADGDLVFGGGSAAEGWRPCDLRERGCLFIYHEASGYEEPRAGRAYWVSDEVVQRVVAQHTPVRSQIASEPMDSREAEPAGTEVLGRTVPPPHAEEAEVVDPGRPALHVVAAVDPEDPRVRLREILAAAPEEGVRRAEIIDRIRMSDSWVDKELAVLRAAGEATCVGRARWRAGGSPVRAMVKEESR